MDLLASAKHCKNEGKLKNASKLFENSRKTQRDQFKEMLTVILTIAIVSIHPIEFKFTLKKKVKFFSFFTFSALMPTGKKVYHLNQHKRTLSLFSLQYQEFWSYFSSQK
jgi:hypothetical protein